MLTVTYQVVLDGAKLSFDVNPMNYEDRLLVPMRTIFEAMGAEVEWDNGNITARKDNNEIKMQIDNNVMYKNDTEITLDVPARNISGKTMVPVRAVAESFSCDVEWDNDKREVIISSVDKEEIEEKGKLLVTEAKSKKFQYGELDKAYISFVYDDTRNDMGRVEKIFENANMPCCFATIPDRISKEVVYGEENVTAKYVLQKAVENGGEVLAHNGQIITELSKDDLNRKYNMFVKTKEKLENEGFTVDGIILSGGTETDENGTVYKANDLDMQSVEPWSYQFYKYSDLYGKTEPYKHTRKIKSGFHLWGMACWNLTDNRPYMTYQAMTLAHCFNT